MKVQITENQFIRILNEQLRGNDLELDRNPYLNDLLDRIQNYGINSLTPDERRNLTTLSQGGKIDEPKQEDPVKGDDSISGDYAMDNDYPDENEAMIPNELNNESYKMFIDLYPEGEAIDVNGETWYAGIAEDNHPYPYLKLASNDKIIKVIPFYVDGNDYKIRLEMGGMIVQYTTAMVPEDEDSMNEFIDKLNRRGLKGMITKVLQSKDKYDGRGSEQ